MKPYCSRACWRAALNRTRLGKSNPNWKGGKSINSSGYVVIRIDGKKKLEHVHLMEKKIGRRLSRNEVVHHKNDDKTDNRLQNLELLTISAHMKLHHPKGIAFSRQARTVTCRFCMTEIQVYSTHKATRFVCKKPDCQRKKQREYDAKSRRKKRLSAQHAENT